MSLKKPLSDIKEVNKLLDKNDQKILRGLGFQPERDGRIHCKCPIHGGDNPLGFSYDPNKKKWRCWTHHCHESCEINGTQVKVGTGLVGLIRAIKQVGFFDALDLGVSYANSETISNFSIKKEVIEEKIYDSGMLSSLNHDVKAFKKIGISENILARHHAFYCGNKNKVLYGRACVPIFNANNQIVGFGGYKTEILPEESPKWWYAGGVKLGNHLFGFNINKEYILEKNTIILVEGIKDVLMCDEAGILNVASTFSCNITNEQRKLLVDNKIKNVILAFDPDKAGQKNAIKAYDKLKLFFNVVDISPNLPKDPGKMTVKELQKHLR